MIDYTNSQIKELINEHIHNARDREMLKRRLCDGYTYERIAEEFGLSSQRVKAIIYKAQEKLIKYL